MTESAPQSEAPKDLDLTFDEPTEAPNPWAPVDDEPDEDLRLPPADKIIEAELWDEVDDLSDEDLSLRPEDSEDLPDPWAQITDLPEPTLGERAPPPPAQPEPRNVRALIGGSEPAQLPKPRASIAWRGTFATTSLEGDELLYTVDLSALRSELLVADWEWEEQESNPVLRIRLTDDGVDLRVSASDPGEPVITLRGLLGGRELSFDVLVKTERERRGLLLGRDVLAEGFLIDPALS